VVEDFEVVEFVGGDSSVESDEQGFEEGLASFKVEVHDLHPEEEGHEGALHDPVEVHGGDSHAEEGESSPEAYGEFSGHHEVFVVGRHLFGSHEVVEEFGVLHGRKVQRVVIAVERVLESLRSGLLGGQFV